MVTNRKFYKGLIIRNNMSRLQIKYDIEPGEFPTISKSISDHLTPNTDKYISTPTEVELEKVRSKLNNQPEVYKPIWIDNFPWSYGAYFARDLGLFPIESPEEVRSLNLERYSVPRSPGCSTGYTLSFYGKNVNGVGDAPMEVRMDGDFRGFTDTLFLLENWKEAFIQNGRGGMFDKVIDIGKNIQGSSPFHEEIISGLPSSLDDFESRINEEKEKLNLLIVDWGINAIRFYDDFIGKPIQKTGYSPSSLELIGPYDFKFIISKSNLDAITRYPNIPNNQVFHDTPLYPEGGSILN